jgi:hypothetical protein
MAGDKKITIKAELLTQGFENAQKLLRPLTDQITQINKLIRPTAQGSQQQGLLGRILNGSNRPGDTIAKQIRADAQSLGELRKAAEETDKTFKRSLAKSIRETRLELKQLVDEKQGLLGEKAETRGRLAAALRLKRQHGSSQWDDDIEEGRKQVDAIQEKVNLKTQEERAKSDKLAELEAQRKPPSVFGSMDTGDKISAITQVAKIFTDGFIKASQVENRGLDIRAEAEASRQSTGGALYERMTNGSGAAILDLYALDSMSKKDGKQTGQSNLKLAYQRADAARKAELNASKGEMALGGIGVLGGLGMAAAGAGLIASAPVSVPLAIAGLATAGAGVFTGIEGKQKYDANSSEAAAMRKLGQHVEQGKATQPIEQAALRDALQNRERRADFGNLYASKYATNERQINEEYLYQLKQGASYGMQEAQSAATLARLSDAVGGTRGKDLFGTVARSERDFGVRRDVAMGTLTAVTEGTKGGDPERAKAIWSDIMSIAMAKGFKDSKLKEDFLTMAAQSQVGAGGAHAGVGMADVYSRVLDSDASRYDMKAAMGGTDFANRLTGNVAGPGGVANFVGTIEALKNLQERGTLSGSISTSAKMSLAGMQFDEMMANPDDVALLTNIEDDDPYREQRIAETRQELIKEKLQTNAHFFDDPEQRKLWEGYEQGDKKSTRLLAYKMKNIANIGTEGKTVDEIVSGLKQMDVGRMAEVKPVKMYSDPNDPLNQPTDPRTASDAANTNIAIASLKNITELFAKDDLRNGLVEMSQSMVLATEGIAKLSEDGKLGDTPALLDSLADSLDKLNTATLQFHQTMAQLGYANAGYGTK